ncbi:MAG: hypothetical protein CSH37_06285 [Thalassolituus sp.]|jgi:hypothetical protein|nr:MAG: hypothetical protein CSH37_06285 [Thalassolituus sp.]|tara:strand:- start:7 stop:393 length:387 start_codon:yes stop_codon:yes gene_type:complete
MLRKLEESIGGTSRGFAILILASVVPILGVMIHCGYNIYLGNGLETYDLVIMDHPILTNLGVSYVEVLIYDAFAFLVLVIGLLFRYYHYRDERDFMKKYNLKGKTGFGSDFKSTRSINSSEYDLNSDD